MPSSCRTACACPIAPGCRTATLGGGAGAARHERQPRCLGISRALSLPPHGVAVFAPDQRGFGDTAVRGYWPGTQALVDDARTMARLLHRRYPHAQLILMGESMGAAVLMCLATAPDPPPADGYVLVAPAVWGRAEMNVFLRAGLWLFANLVPGFTVTGRVARVSRERQPRGDQAAVAGSADHPRDTIRHGAGPGGSDGRRAGRRASVPCAGAVPVWRQGRADPGQGHGGDLARAAGGAGAGVLSRRATICCCATTSG